MSGARASPGEGSACLSQLRRPHLWDPTGTSRNSRGSLGQWLGRRQRPPWGPALPDTRVTEVACLSHGDSGATLHGLRCPVLSHTTSPPEGAPRTRPEHRRHNQPAPACAEPPARAAGPREPPGGHSAQAQRGCHGAGGAALPAQEALPGHHLALPSGALFRDPKQARPGPAPAPRHRALLAPPPAIGPARGLRALPVPEQMLRASLPGERK